MTLFTRLLQAFKYNQSIPIRLAELLEIEKEIRADEQAKLNNKSCTKKK
jgi:hypothetical protein